MDYSLSNIFNRSESKNSFAFKDLCLKKNLIGDQNAVKWNVDVKIFFIKLAHITNILLFYLQRN